MRLEGSGEELTWPRRGPPGAGAERTPHSQTAEAAASSWGARYGKGCASWSFWRGWTPRGRPEMAATVASSCLPPPPPAAPMLLSPPPGPCERTYLGAGSPAFTQRALGPHPLGRELENEDRAQQELHRCACFPRGDRPGVAQCPRAAKAALSASPGEAGAPRAPGKRDTVRVSGSRGWGPRHLLESLGTASPGCIPSSGLGTRARSDFDSISSACAIGRLQSWPLAACASLAR